MKLEDNICPICLYIFIEPVTMPCEHELCLKCFKQNVEEANFCCPMCRIRISTWARRAARNNALVNEKRWKEIKKHFPSQVKKRLEGEEDDDEEVKALNVSIKLAEPGEIRSEFEEQLRKLREQRAEERRTEQEASELLIRQLQEEEEKVRQERALLQEQDEALARELSEALPSESPIELRTRSARSFINDSRSNSASIEPFLQQAAAEDGERSPSPYPYPCLSPVSSGAGKLCVDKGKVAVLEERFRRQKVLRDQNLITTQDVAQLEESFRLNRMHGTANTDSLDIDCLPRVCETKTTLQSVMSLSSLTSLTQNEELKHMSETLDTPLNLLAPVGSSPLFLAPPPCDTHDDIEGRGAVDGKISTTSCITISSDGSKCSLAEPDAMASRIISRSASAQSIDSITQELNHFRPIRTCPLTPPRRLPSGKLVEPQLIRTTPRNVQNMNVTSPYETSLSDIDAGSPIMKRRLSELAEERKNQVKTHSKFTATVGGQASPGHHSSDNENRNPEGAGKMWRAAGRSQTTCTRSVDLKDISNSPHQKRPGDLISGDGCESEARKKLILPLEPSLILDDVILVHPRDLETSKKENEGFVKQVSASVSGKPNSKLSRRTKRNTSGHVRYAAQEPGSPQPSIMDWIKTSQQKNVLPSPGRVVNSEEGMPSKVSSELSPACLKPNCSTVSSPLRDASISKSGRHRKLLRSEDFVYTECASPKKSAKRQLPCTVSSQESKDGYCSDMRSESSDDFLELSTVKKKLKVSSKIDQLNGTLSKHCEPARKKTGLKTVKKSLKSTKTIETKKGSSSKTKTMPDFFHRKDMVTTCRGNMCNLSLSEQELEDHKLAEELQRQFELEAKLKLNTLRFKGTSDEYSFRNNRQKRTVFEA